MRKAKNDCNFVHKKSYYASIAYQSNFICNVENMDPCMNLSEFIFLGQIKIYT